MVKLLLLERRTLRNLQVKNSKLTIKWWSSKDFYLKGEICSRCTTISFISIWRKETRMWALWHLSSMEKRGRMYRMCWNCKVIKVEKVYLLPKNLKALQGLRSLLVKTLFISRLTQAASENSGLQV